MLRIFLILVFSISSIVLTAQNASQWRGENRDGIYDSEGLLKQWPEDGPKLLWHFDELGQSHASVTVGGDKIYTSGTGEEEGYVIAFSNEGKEVWRTNYGKEWMEDYEGNRSTPVYNDGRIYMLSGYGLLSCLDAESGNLIWKVDLFKSYDGVNIQWGITENLLIFDNQLICMPGGKDANVISLDKNTGKLIWKSKGMGDQSAYCSPQLIDHKGKKMIITHSAAYILGIDAISGQLLWSFDWPNRWSVQPNTPIYKDGKVFCASGYGQGSVMLKIADDGKSVKELWRNKTLDNQMGGFVLLDGKIYGAGQNSRKWVCLDWETGNEIYSSSALKVGNIIAANGLLYWYNQSGVVALVEPKADAFNIISQFKVPYGMKQHWAHLTINNKRLFVRHGNSVMAYDISE